MSDFRPITTQEEFDAAIVQRLDRARNSVRREYEAQLEQLRTDLLSATQQAERSTQAQQQLQEALDAAQSETRRMSDALARLEIIHERGLPMDAMELLTGSTKEEMEDCARRLEAVSRKMGNNTPLPLKETETPVGNGQTGAWQELLRTLSD